MPYSFAGFRFTVVSIVSSFLCQLAVRKPAMRIINSSLVWIFKILVAWVWLTPLATGISVPTGKLTPITPAKPQPRTPPRTAVSAPSAPAPVVEYTLEHPEPPPLDPSYVPVTYKYLSALSPNSIFYVPVRFRNVHNTPGRDIEYVFPRKYLGATSLGKNDQYNYREKHPAYDYPAKPVYVPIKVVDFPSSTASKPVQASAPPTHRSDGGITDYGFTTRDTEYTLPGKSDVGFYSKHSSDKRRPYTGYSSKAYDYPSGKGYGVTDKGYATAKSEDYGAASSGKEVDETRKPSHSAYPKKAVDLSPRKYYYHFQHKY